MRLTKYIVNWFIWVFFMIALGWGLFVLIEMGIAVFIIVPAVLYLINLITTFALFVQTRHSDAKLAWLMVIAIIPILGPILYSIFGLRYSGRKNDEEYNKINKPIFGKQQKSIKLDSNAANDVLERQSRMAKRPILSSNFKILNGGDLAYPALFRDLEQAKKFIHINYYIIKRGEIWTQLKSILINKVKEGLEVRLIVDDFGKWALPWYELRELGKLGLKIKIYGKVHFPFISSENGFRTHRKYVVIDGYIVHTGGLNISDEYAHYSKKYGFWVDLQARISGDAARQYSLLFLQDWNRVSKELLSLKKFAPNPKEQGDTQSIMIEDGPDNVLPLIHDSLVFWITSSTKKISLCTPYFVPTESILTALRTMAKAGVEVEIFIPGLADKKSVYLATHYYASLLIPYGVKFYKVNNTLVHSKIGVFDGKLGYVGTANVDMRSMYTNFEVVNLLKGDAVKQVSKVFDEYKTLSSLVTMKEVKNKGIFKRLKLTWIKVFTPIM